MSQTISQEKISLSAFKREVLGKKVKNLKKKGILPAVLYGPKEKTLPLEVNLREFKEIYEKAGESSLISLKINQVFISKGDEENEEKLVLIHEVQRDPLTNEFSHVDFYHPSLEKEVEVEVPLIFEGEAPGVKTLGGTLVKNISQVKVKVLPQKLPKEIRVNVENLKTFEDHILIKDLNLPEGVKVLKEPEEIVALVIPPEKVEEELEKPIEEKVEKVEKVEEKEKEGEAEGEEK